MRVVCTISTDETSENPYEFAYYLTSQGVENECEEISSDAVSIYRIWVYDEDKVERAKELYTEYKLHPHDSKYKKHYEQAVRAEDNKFLKQKELDAQRAVRKRPRILSPAPYGPISILVLLTVVGIFIWGQFHRGMTLPPKLSGIIQAPMLSPLEQTLLYDYPHYFQLRDELYKIYTPKEIEEKQAPSMQALQLIQEIKQTKVWMGIYDRFIMHTKNPDFPLLYDGPIFEQISKGQFWRLFTPALLHFDLLHIFFNVLWFILLGNQIEYRIGWWRYLFFILVVGIFSNTAQYLMSGPFFMGLSGIVVGMAGFIFARQQVAPWEGYLLHRFTLLFLGIFVIGMFLLQMVFFFMQIFGRFELTIGIANTAHLMGGLIGYLLGRMRLFSIHYK